LVRQNTIARPRSAASAQPSSCSEALGAGFAHIALGLPAQPYPANVAQWVADELIAKSAK